MTSGQQKTSGLQLDSLHPMLENLPVPACLLDATLSIQFANRAFIKTFGTPDNDACHKFLFQHKKPCRNCPARKVLSEGASAIRHKSLTGDNYMVHHLPVGEIDGKLMFLQFFQKESEAPGLLASLSASIIDAMSELVVILNREGRIVAANRAWREFVRNHIRQSKRYSEGGDYFAALRELAKKGNDSWLDLLRGVESVVHGERKEFSMENTLHCDDETQWFFSRCHRFSGRGSGRQTIVAHSPITELKQAENTAHQLAYFDSLTGLPNRLLLNDRLRHALDWAQRDEKCLAVLFLDLDHFKVVNDSLGHSAGDELLRAVGRRLTGCIRKTDTVARIGGDEFIILLPSLARLDDVSHLAEKIIHSLSRPFRIKGQEIYTSTSIGISIHPDDSNDAETLIRNADLAMYQAKEHGRNTYMLFSEKMNQRMARRVELENHLRHALERNEFHLVYQDQVDTQTGMILGVEALLRWQHPNHGLLTPEAFLDIAEETGLIIPIGEWVLHTACRQNRAWLDAGYPPLRVSVNLSHRQMLQSDLADNIRQILDKTGLPAEYLQTEITEGAIRSDFERARDVITRLKQLGLSIALDNFGSGFSSLSQLRHLHIDCLNIGHTFISEITNESRDTAIIRSIIATAHNLGMKVVAEGVETTPQRDFLRTHGCDEIQGFHFLRPTAAAGITAYLAQISSNKDA
jgi:diguanylate cyclase (GGDEF)-like protein